MGMFDYVNYSAPCPKCGEVLTGWQSKDGPCELSRLEPWQVKHFYTNCDKCRAWVDKTVKLTSVPEYVVEDHPVIPPEDA